MTFAFFQLVRMLRPNTLSLTLLLAVLTGIGPLSVDMYLASLPEIGRLLQASPERVQLTISVYLIGFAFGQMFYGPLSDRHGRRPVLLAALLVFTLASVACALAPSIQLLITGRFFQALGAAGTVVLARSVVRDIYEGARVGRELSRMAAIMALAPMAAPLMGGVLQSLFGWRSNFVLLIAFGAAACTVIWRLFPETLRQRSPEPVSIASIFRSYRLFFRNGSYVAHLFISACTFMGLFTWIFMASFVLQDRYGLSPLAFGVAFATSSGGYLIGTSIAARYVSSWGVDRTLGRGCVIMTAGGVAMVLVHVAELGSAVTVLFCMATYLAGMGLVLPQAQAGALLPFPDRAGAASSLVGLTQQTAAAIIGAAVGHAFGQTEWPLAVIVAMSGCAALIVWYATRAIRRRELAAYR